MNKEALNLKPLAIPFKIIGAGLKAQGKSLARGWNRGLFNLGRKLPVLGLVGAGGYGAYQYRNELGDLLQSGANKVKTRIDKGLEDAKKDINKPPQQAMATTEATPDAVANAANPLASLFGSKFFVPQKYLDLFPEKYHTEASIGWNAGASALLAAALIGGYRVLRHEDELIDIEDADRPGKDLANQISTTFQGPLTPKKRKKKNQEKVATEVSADNTFSPTTLLQTAVPVGATILAAAAAYKGADALMDAHRNFRLDRNIAKKEDLVKRLIETRARVAKGNATEEEVTSVIQPVVDAGLYMKRANYGLDQMVQGAGVLGSAIILASALGSYAYTSAGDENNLKYKAYKKALREYAKAKSGMTPITVAPADSSEYFGSIDQGTTTTPSVARYQPALDTDSLNKPISVSF